MFQLFQVNETQGHAVLAAMNTIITLEGRKQPSEIERRSLLAIAKTMFHLEVNVDELPSSLPTNLASLLNTNALQHEALHFSAMLPFLSTEDEVERMTIVENMAEALGQKDVMVTELKKLAEGKKTKFALHTMRDSKTITGKSAMGTMWGMIKGKLHLDGDKALLEKFEAYRHFPADTLGYEMARYYTDTEFGFPGTPGEWSSNTLHMHDFHHVMAGYPTTPLGEMCVIAFESGHQGTSENDLMSTAIFSLLELQLGIDPFGTQSEAVWKNQLQPEAFFRAFERGGKVTGDIFKAEFDMHTLMAEKIADVRARYGIEEEGALVLSNEDKWCGEMGVVGQRESPDMVSKGKVL
ncbi:MAG: hypothetical protein VX589_07050 [Myxococcota bacterium]|nr:hypothetical protein [Myxococcota bacterium]